MDKAIKAERYFKNSLHFLECSIPRSSALAVPTLLTMRFFAATFATLAVLAAPILAAPSGLLPVETFPGATSGQYIVRFKEGVSPKTWVKKLGLAKAVSFENINGLAS